jgi:hypothetical protein
MVLGAHCIGNLGGIIYSLQEELLQEESCPVSTGQQEALVLEFFDVDPRAIQGLGPLGVALLEGELGTYNSTIHSETAVMRHGTRFRGLHSRPGVQPHSLLPGIACNPSRS